MKKFCDKISKHQWRMSVPSINSTLFRRSPSNCTDESDSNTECSYNLNDNHIESDNSGSYTVNSDSDKYQSATNSILLEENEEIDSDRESKYEDASPMYEKKIDFTKSIEELEQNLYADVENSIVLSKSIDDISEKFVYDIPKISFSFFETPKDLDYEMVKFTNNSTPKMKSEVKIVLAAPSFSENEQNGSKNDTEQINETFTKNDQDGASNAIKQINDISKILSEDGISLSETRCEIFDQKIIEFDVSKINLEDLSLTNCIMRCDSEPNINIELRSEHLEAENHDEDLYKVPTSSKRLSQSLRDLNIISAKDDEEISYSNGSTSKDSHNVILKEEILESMFEDISSKRLSQSLRDFNEITVKELKENAVTEYESKGNPNVNLKEENLGNIDDTSHKRLSKSLRDFNTITVKDSEEIECEKGCTSKRSPIILHNVILKEPLEDKVDDTLVRLDYCNARSKLPLKIRRATLIKKPQMRIKTPESWSQIRTKVNNIIAVHSAAQRVGAAHPSDKTINLDQFYKNSKDKYKKFVKKSGKLFHKKREQENLDPNIDSYSDSSSQMVKNDAFFEKVEAKDSSCQNSDVNSDGGGGSKSVSSLPKDEDRSDFDFSTLKSAFRKSRIINEGQNGFDDLRRFVKQGGDFCKELSAILQERADTELQYAKSLSKLSGKLLRACRDGVGGINDAWKNVATDMETRADAHRQFSSSLCDDIVKPLRQLTEGQHKQRKLSECAVDKTARGLSDWRAAEAKSKKQSHQCARDNEKLQDALLDVRLSRSSSLIQLAHMHNHKTLSDKESAKLEGKKRKAEDAVKKADIEYYTLCVRAERARLEWESAVLRGSTTFQTLEEDRLNNLKSLLNSYLNHTSEMCPKLLQGTDKLRVPIKESDPSKDMSAFINLRNNSQHVSEQLLPDFYCEHITLAMNRERRKQALVKLVHLIRQDIERERKSKNGLENLSRAIKQTPNFGTEDSQQNVAEKLYHMRSMLTYLEGARYKVHSALAELENRQRTSHPLASHITITRDKSGLQQSVLKVPQWLREEFIEHDKSSRNGGVCETELLPDWTDRGMADGNSNQHDSDFDEFSSQASSSVAGEECPNVMLGRCKALYAYTANLPDELNLQPGDILSIYRKQEDGWWLGECNGCVGIFPATYVETIL